MALTKKDIQMIQKIVDRNILKYVLTKPSAWNITYEELEKEIVKLRKDIPEVEIIRME